ncbi:hypothetical protein BS17DRAFT_775390 [Gyrodon lividus]|nr:hypothetical protein BS17DRAFT_775390 [Gyrodon lividus]
MLFAKGPRFAPGKIVPDKPPEVPNPGASSTTARPASRNSRPPSTTGKHSGDDRYMVLLKRIEDLERVHTDDKKQHQAELDRHKSGLSCLTKRNTDQSEGLEKLKKQNEAYELRVHELNKNSAAERAEIKELRAKLRMCEHERNQLTSKQPESSDTKNAASSLEAKRREDVKERDRRGTVLEKTVAVERRKREMLESCLDDVKKKADEEAVKLRANSKSLKQQLDAAQKDGQKSQQTAPSAGVEPQEREEELLTQLEQCRIALSRVAEEYRHLASTTVTTKVHAALKEEHVALQLCSLRLERKLANSEGQVTELANLIRQTKEENKLLAQQLRDAEREISFSQSLQEDSLDHINQLDGDISCLENELAVLRVDITQDQGYALEALLQYHAAAHDFYRRQTDDMLSQVDDMENVAKQERAANRTLAEEMTNHIAFREASYTEHQKLQTELAGANHALAKEQVSLAETRQSREALQDKVNQLEQKMNTETSQHKATLQKERDAVQKISAQLHMSKTAEETLRAEIEQLHFELADASRFQDAYYKLLDETEELLARNNLAEDEAERLSRFNAEILGHHNPAQRIVYVDRIRRELADTKQKLLVCTRDCDTLVVANEDLQHELELYKSSTVPTESKPRSLFIRVSRSPLTNQGLNVGNNRMSIPLSVSATKHMILEHLPGLGDMTLDELVR